MGYPLPITPYKTILSINNVIFFIKHLKSSMALKLLLVIEGFTEVLVRIVNFL